MDMSAFIREIHAKAGLDYDIEERRREHLKRSRK
jgi:hypothetical protein